MKDFSSAVELEDFLKVENRRRLPKSYNVLIQRNLQKQKAQSSWALEDLK